MANPVPSREYLVCRSKEGPHGTTSSFFNQQQRRTPEMRWGISPIWSQKHMALFPQATFFKCRFGRSADLAGCDNGAGAGSADGRRVRPGIAPFRAMPVPVSVQSARGLMPQVSCSLRMLLTLWQDVHHGVGRQRVQAVVDGRQHTCNTIITLNKTVLIMSICIDESDSGMNIKQRYTQNIPLPDRR